MKQARHKVSKSEVVGTLESVPGTAVIVEWDDENKPIYAGETIMDWNCQETQKDVEGNDIYVLQNGELASFDDLEFN